MQKQTGIKPIAMKPIVMNRRELVTGLAAGTIVPFIEGCVQNSALGRNQLLLVSDGQLAQLSASAWRDIKHTQRASSDRVLRRKVERVGSRIADSAGLQNLNWEFEVFDNDQINAWVMPGGKVGFYKGILDIMDNDDQVSVVMGHEVGHVVGHHAAERYSQKLAANVGMTIAQIALASSDISYKHELAAILGAGVTFGVILPYSRKHEYEADRLGVGFMGKSNYNVQEALNFWQRMSSKNKRKPLEFMSTHPSDENRIRAMRSYINRMGLL